MLRTEREREGGREREREGERRNWEGEWRERVEGEGGGRVAPGCIAMTPPQHPSQPFKIHAAVSLNYRPLLIDMKGGTEEFLLPLNVVMISSE